MTALVYIDSLAETRPLTQFTRYIGIDYSGAEAPVSRLRALQVYACAGDAEAVAVEPYDRRARNWCRKEVARFVHESLLGDEPCIIGIDHGFAFPLSYYQRHELDSWDAFLGHFCETWRTDFDHMHVEFARRENPAGGSARELRLCERWTTGAKSVFHFDVQGSVAKSTHAGIPWLRQLRRDRKLRARTHFWPFDGFSVEPGKSVVAEIFPSLFRRRYRRAERTADEHDAFVVAAWLREMDTRGALREYFNPPLTLPERRQAALEGWILGVR
ncbi:MAG: hypothetical protein H6977_16900 [Gammaproteobacteria bacterium]|nr:hypothetical protein [Gammaproteobacteria bacterium]MCP5201682.1 hypothetical protein [Gammaproteobacteria bacterium]